MNHRVQRVSADGVFEMAGGSSDGHFSTEPGKFIAPTGLDSQRRVYVSETWEDRIQVFTQDGVFLFGWGKNIEHQEIRFGDIKEIAMDGDYFLYAPDSGKDVEDT